jgi:hypothetical protein
MNTLFCTPEQGARLKELLPELESAFMWVYGNGAPKIKWISKKDLLPPQGDEYTYTPALTLQELRDVAQREFAGEIVADPVFANAFETWVYTSSAPDLAEWLIARLEEL